MSNEMQTVDISSDVSAFCALLARIIERGLAQQDQRILAMLSLPVSERARKEGVTDEPAA
jgi:hypothetical protein